MRNIGITGQTGFIGTHLYNTLSLQPEKFRLIDFEKHYFDSAEAMDAFTKKCDCIVHLAAMNRHGDPQVIYDTNIALVKKLISSLERIESNAHVIFSSSTQEERDNLYGKSKKDGRVLLNKWAEENNATFTGLIIPNVFGPFGDPYYNSVVATFSHQLTHDETPQIKTDAELKLIYVSELARKIEQCIQNPPSKMGGAAHAISETAVSTVSGLLNMLNRFNEQYVQQGIIPDLGSAFEINLFNTFRSYLDHSQYFPQKYTKHADERGAFVETMKLHSGGQVSFSTTVPGVTRGEHYHTRKIERFAVIKGDALIEMRRIGTDKVMEFTIKDGIPAYVDMPIWYTHNITNIGEEELYTMFWINEFYDPDDADTYYEKV